ncbi:MAG: hypothetical protein V8R16_07705 [Bacilli bacterium]
MDYNGSKNNSLGNSTSLINGEFALNRLSTLFTDTAIGGDIIHFDLIDELSVDYIISFSHKKEDLYKNKFDIDEYILKKEKYYFNRKNQLGMIGFNFENWNSGNINPLALNKFLDNVICQVEYCALAKKILGLFF